MEERCQLSTYGTADDASVLRQLEPIGRGRSGQAKGENLKEVWTVHLVRVFLYEI